MIRKLLIACGLFFSTAAHAEWFEADSRNFIVYSEGSADAARDFAAKLERFNFVLRTYHQVTAPPAPNKLRIFLFSSAAAVGRMAGSPGIAGYYVPEERGQMLVGTSSRAALRVGDLDPESILLHEYTHHFMYRYFPAAYPVWYSEGFAEFWGSTRFADHDVVEVGRPAEHRFNTFHQLGWLPINQLFVAHNYQELGGFAVFQLYAEGWLILRYVFEHPERRRQLERYLNLINGGTSYADAMHQAFPDLATFNNELFQYSGQVRYNVLQLPFRTIDVGPIAIRPLRPAEQALIVQEIKLSTGYLQSEAADVANDVRGIAAHYPDDPFAIRMVMETEHLAGNDAASLAAADRLLAIEPNNALALTTKAIIQIAGLRAAHSVDPAAWNAPRQLLVRAHRAAENDPIVLEAYYDSFVAQGVRPPESAQNALYAAMELAPSDGELRYKVARDFEQRNMIRDAIAIIRPIAYASPHRGNESEGERQRRERREERYRAAGQVIHESPREMLTRLEEKASHLPPAPAEQPPAAAH